MVIFVHKCPNPNYIRGIVQHYYMIYSLKNDWKALDVVFECTSQWNTGRRDATVAKRLSIGIECKRFLVLNTMVELS